MSLPNETARLRRNVSSAITAAVNDAKEKDAYGTARIGVVFAVPYLEICSAAECDDSPVVRNDPKVPRRCRGLGSPTAST
jgi:hypothetical protein